jgi:hypothetical protein
VRETPKSTALRDELRTTSVSTPLPPERAPLPNQALAVDVSGEWVLLLAAHRACCTGCGRELGRGRKVVWSRDTRRTWCTRCCQSVALVPTEYGAARRRSQVNYGEWRRRLAEQAR